jgi:hypothetical protein
MTSINYTPPPTLAKFMRSQSFGRIAAGPVGSGKTTACILELFRRACEQIPAEDGLRYTRFAVVRGTLQQLKDTILKDCMSWFREIAEWKVSNSTLYINIGDVRSEWLFIPLDDPEDQRRLLSLQLTGAWLSEAIELSVDLVSPLAGRCGRYPSATMGGCTWMGIIIDTNLPSENSPWYKLMETDTPPDFQVFIQPGGMSDNAENLQWLHQTPETLKLKENDPRRLAQGRTYYERFIRSNSPGWCQRYVHAKYGDDPSGSAVFGESFKSTFHVVDSLEPVQGHPILIGQDFGRDPWSVICQIDHKGRLLVLEEVSAEDIGLEQHVQRSLRPKMLDTRYLGKKVAIIGDPAGRSKDSIYEETSFDVLKREGFMCFPAPTNDIDPRVRAVESMLLSQRDGGPAIVFDRSRCPTLVRAMGGGYRFGKTKAGQRKPSPDKNEFSHVADALQYVCLGAHGGMVTGMVMRHLGQNNFNNSPKEPVTAAGWT